MLYTSSENQCKAEYFQQENIQWNIINIKFNIINYIKIQFKHFFLNKKVCWKLIQESKCFIYQVKFVSNRLGMHHWVARVRAGLLNNNNGFTSCVFIRVPTQDPHLIKMFYVIQLGRKQVRPHKLIKEHQKQGWIQVYLYPNNIFLIFKVKNIKKTPFKNVNFYM